MGIAHIKMSNYGLNPRCHEYREKAINRSVFTTCCTIGMMLKNEGFTKDHVLRRERASFKRQKATFYNVKDDLL